MSTPTTNKGGGAPPTVSMTIEIKRPGPVQYSTDCATVGVYGIPVDATPEQVAEYVDASRTIFESATDLLYKQMIKAFKTIKGKKDETGTV